MGKSRRKHSAELKAEVALKALCGSATVPELAAHYKVAPKELAKWKEQAWEGVLGVFSGRAERPGAPHDAYVKELAKIGQASGHCAVCGRKLTNPEAVARGIGPVCGAKLLGLTKTRT